MAGKQRVTFREQVKNVFVGAVTVVLVALLLFPVSSAVGVGDAYRRLVSSVVSLPGQIVGNEKVREAAASGYEAARAENPGLVEAIESAHATARSLSEAARAEGDWETAATTGHDYEAARQTLDTLAVKGRAPKTGYTRDQFGPAWKDVDANACDTRNDILNRDLADKTWNDPKQCVVLSGTLVFDPYTGKTIGFQRGQSTSSAIQIDHRVALSDAWQKGAQQWDAATRERFANDPINLVAVDGPANSQKGDGDAATWLPPLKSGRCEYVASQVEVKAVYGLWVTQAEKDAMARVLEACV